MSSADIVGIIVRGLFVAVLIILSVYDVKNRGVPLWGIIISALIASAYLIFQIFNSGGFKVTAGVNLISEENSEDWVSVKKLLFSAALGLLPGVFQLVISFATRKAGAADGIILCIIGAMENYVCGIITWAAASLLIAVVSIVLLCMKKVNRNTKMPFIPFLTAGYLFGKIVFGI